MDAQQIYDNFHDQAKGTQGLAAAEQTAQELAAKYQDRAMTTQQMIDTIQSGWKGAAGEAASQGLAPLAENALNNHQHLGTGQDIVSRQVDSFHTAASQVQPVPAAPTLNDAIAAVAAGQSPQPILDQMENSQAAQQSNVDVYSRYVAASQYNTTNMPTLNSVDTAGAPIAVVPPATSQVSASQGATRPAAPTAAARVPVRGTSGRTSGSGARVSSAPSTGGTTRTSAAVPVISAPSTPVPVSQPAGSGSVNIGPVPVEPIVPVGGFLPPGAGEMLPGPGGSRSLPPPDGLPGEGARSGLRSGSGLGAPPGEGEPVAGGREGGVPGEGEGGSSGVAPDVAAEEEAMAAERGVTAGPSAAGPMLGGRGGKGGADAQHQRRYGLDEDGEARFGTQERTAPPVIGETPAEREHRYAKDAGRH